MDVEGPQKKLLYQSIEIVLGIIIGDEGQPNILVPLTRYSPVIHFYPQSGICVQKYNFWPKNDVEKWSRKSYFEIPPCEKTVIFITEFVILGPFMK